ncbi:hypothetical protein BY458DRAFT_505549 [Sporodiniella umbellata]|nr:hypothetical protein BY458DRAFT_505549 [Sporodiniella umbellata]
MQSFTSETEWPLHEHHEKYIMRALSLMGTSSHNYSTHPSTCSRLCRNQSSQYLRCSVCQRKFHSEGNLINHKQLYH